jgi:pSer/pThr/pTyr-binding forkhead associated (FHA) protein
MTSSASPSGPDPQPSAKPREATRLESVDEIRQAIRNRRPSAADKPAADDTHAYRPMRRPPLALLCILDDGKEEGEWLRLRADHVIIGRSEGDITIPHDSMISGRHAELSRRPDQGRYRWHLTDLQSTNGTYVRVGTAVLRHGQELLLGSHRYRFEAAPQGMVAPGETGEADVQRKATRGWQSVEPSNLLPSLVELTAKGEGQRFLLAQGENWVGRDTGHCAVALPSDPLISPRHARIYRDPKGRWHVENMKSLNGTWLRIEQMALDAACQFQLGEQRFLLRVL